MITRIIILIILAIAPITTLARSEITGYISTDPKRPGEDITQNNEDDDVETPVEDPILTPAQSNGGSSVLIFKNKEKKTELAINEEGISDEPIVLGFDRLPENTLVRDESGRIYVIKGKIKQVIWDLAELGKYAGKEILDLPDSELALYPSRRFFDGRLIRQYNTNEIFIVRNGRKQHVKSIVELTSRFFGQKIYNVGKEEFVLYLA